LGASPIQPTLEIQSMANLVQIADEQAELINGGYRGRRHRSGGIKLVFPALTSLTIGTVIIGSSDFDVKSIYKGNPPA
jgi:hypothetical protein